jgi:PEP-CTERM motif-containing protein
MTGSSPRNAKGFSPTGSISMNSIKKTTFAGLCALATLGAVSNARANPITVTVWGGNYLGTINTITGSNPDSAKATGVPTSSALATFTYNGPINWQDNSGNNGSDYTQNLFSEFFTSADITSFSSAITQTQFLNTSMSAVGNTWWSFIQITGTTWAGLATITHDDGASVYSGSLTDYSSPSQVAATTANFAIGNGPFTIDYIEANGSPSDLVFSVPEPTSMALLGAGLIGMGAASRRRKSITTTC